MKKLGLRAIFRYFFRSSFPSNRQSASFHSSLIGVSPELKPLQPQMPLCGKIHCNPTEGLPLSQEFLYEIRTN